MVRIRGVLRVWAAQLTMHFQELRHGSACMQALPAPVLLYDHRSLCRCWCCVIIYCAPCSRCRFQVHLFQLTLPSNNLGWLAEDDMQ